MIEPWCLLIFRWTPQEVTMTGGPIAHRTALNARISFHNQSIIIRLMTINDLAIGDRLMTINDLAIGET